jgi:hypothetical protein
MWNVCGGKCDCRFGQVKLLRDARLSVTATLDRLFTLGPYKLEKFLSKIPVSPAKPVTTTLGPYKLEKFLSKIPVSPAKPVTTTAKKRNYKDLNKISGDVESGFLIAYLQ